MSRWTPILLVALSSAVLGAACKRGADGSATRGDGPASAPNAPNSSNQVLARVGDRVITVADYVAALEHMDQFDRMRYQAPERRQELLGEMIDVYLLADEARDKGYDKDPIAEQEVREILRDAMLKKAREGVPPPSEIADDESRAYYDQHRADFRDPERRRVSVLVAPSDKAARTLLELARKASPTEWGELVRTRSPDGHTRAGTPPELAGDLGFVSPPGDPRGANPRVPQEVRAAVFEAEKVGDVLPRVVASGERYYVVKWTSRVEGHDRTFDEAKRAIQVKLAQEKIRAKEDALVEDLRRRYPVQIDEAALGQVSVELPRSDGGT
jgi:parvulin-like peptidyl-prolyl isomerase